MSYNNIHYYHRRLNKHMWSVCFTGSCIQTTMNVTEVKERERVVVVTVASQWWWYESSGG